MKKMQRLAGQAGTKLRNRSRSVKHRLIEIGRASRSRGRQNRERFEKTCRRLLAASGHVVAQAKRFSAEVAGSVKRCSGVIEQAALEGLKKYLDTRGV